MFITRNNKFYQIEMTLLLGYKYRLVSDQIYYLLVLIGVYQVTKPKIFISPLKNSFSSLNQNKKLYDI